MKILKRILRITVIVVAAIALLICGANIFVRVSFSAFFDRSEKYSNIPGTRDNFVQQGLCEYNGGFLTAGYMSDGSASRVYYFDKEKSYYIELANEDGTKYDGHAGGIAINGEYVYITNAKKLDVFSLSDFSADKKTAKAIGKIDAPIKAAFCSVNGGFLFIGSFYREQGDKYKTEEWEHIKTPDGTLNPATIISYRLDVSAKDNFGVKKTPESVFSAPALVQGICFTPDRMVLSTSYGLASSHLYFYEFSSSKKDSIEVDGIKANLYYLDGKVLRNTVKAIPMSEGIVYKEGKIYIMSEAASNKYIFGKFVGLGNFYSYNV